MDKDCMQIFLTCNVFIEANLKQEHRMWYKRSSVRGHNSKNSKNIAFRVMPLVLQLYLVMVSKYSKFGVDTFNNFCVMGYIKVFARQGRRSSDHNGSTFSSKETN